ncbi:hypothetical protein AGMMS50249_4080 [candidate division SR1 bacterium]|nr:hypothetical protein AGMMS50249_4080 [candidate division SR1 bacterium]
MKKIIGIIAGLSLLAGFGTFAAVNTANNCLNVDLANGDRVCISINKYSTSYEVSLKDHSFTADPRGLSTITLGCNIQLPNGTIVQLNKCAGEFTCSSSVCRGVEELLIDVRTDRSYGMEYGNYDFANGYRANSGGGGGGSSDNNNTYLSVSSNNTSPELNNYVNLTVETSSNYRGYVEFEMQYRSTSSSSRQTVSSSSYFSASSQFTNGYQFTSSDNGYRNFNSFVSFAREGYYRLYVEDNTGREDYVQFYVEGNSSSNNNTLYVSASNTSPSTNQYIDITAETNSSYRGWISFAIEYRSSTSYSRSTISKNSSDITVDSYFQNGYRFTSSDNGYKKLSQIIRFNRTGQYRITVSDDNYNEKTLTFYVDTSGSSTNNNNLKISTNTLYPSLDQSIGVYVEADSSFRGWVDFSLQYRASTSDTWRTASTSYYSAANYFTNGYQFTSSDYGYHNFTNFMRFTRSGYYRLYVRDTQGNENYVQINVDEGSSSSSVAGFTSSELKKVTAVSQIWDSVITKLKNKSYNLRNDSYWQRLSDSMYTNMRDVVRNINYRTFSTYSDFFRAFNDWMNYTTKNS